MLFDSPDLYYVTKTGKDKPQNYKNVLLGAGGSMTRGGTRVLK
jgi:hypothetical protein